MTKLEQYYNKFHEEHRLTTRHGQVEFSTSMHYIRECIGMLCGETAGGSTEQTGGTVSADTAKKCTGDAVTSDITASIKIADIGAGTGRYSVELCHQGYDVTAVELVKHNLEILRNKHENIKTWQGDARSLNFLPDETFDIVILFGPLYHLHGDEEKLKALSEAARIVKKGGFILAGYVMNDYSVISYCFKNHKWAEVAAKGGLTADFHTICTEDDLYDYVRLSDINRIAEKSGLKRYKTVAVDGAADYMRRELNEMSEEEFSAFLEYQKQIAEMPEMLGASSHVVDILQK